MADTENPIALNRENFGPGSPLRVISDAQDGILDAHDRLRNAVTWAREEGTTWAEIGTVLHITRQAAHERFSLH
jgi:hypothetical protein